MGSVCTEAQGPQSPAPRHPAGEGMAGTGAEGSPITTGLSQVPRSLTRQKEPAFFQVLGSKLPTALNIPGAGHVPLPDPAQRGYCLVLTGTAAQRRGGQDTSLTGFLLLCFHGFTFSCLCHPGARIFTSGPSQPSCSFSRSLGNGEEEEGGFGAFTQGKGQSLFAGPSLTSAGLQAVRDSIATVRNSSPKHLVYRQALDPFICEGPSEEPPAL